VLVAEMHHQDMSAYCERRPRMKYQVISEQLFLKNQKESQFENIRCAQGENNL
jgi:hypothetical protein